MNESEARQVLLVRSLETPPGIDQWQEEDRDRASRLAVAQLGEQASSEQFIVRRAALAVDRLQGRDPQFQRLLSSVTWRGWILPALVITAFLFGLIADAVSANRQINILAPPLLALLIWNLAVFVMIGVNWLLGSRRRADGTAAPGQQAGAEAGADSRLANPRQVDVRPTEARPTEARAAAARPAEVRAADTSPARDAASLAGRAQRPAGPLTRWLARLAGAALPGRDDGSRPPALGRFLRDWLEASAALTTARSHACLHFAAAAFAAGTLAGLYARGLAFEFLAGWDSTFLDATQVHRLLQVVLGPASALTGLSLPDADHLAGLRFSVSPGENAARWIHLFAVTISLFVIMPRLLLGFDAQWHASRLAWHFPLSLDDPYFRHLDRRHRGKAAVVQVLPYSFTISDTGRPALERLMHRTYGENARVELAPPARMGDEDLLAEHWQPDPGATLVIVLYSATATPEHENHGAILDETRRLVAGGAPVIAMVDEGGFRQRFGADAQRLASRQAAWRKLVEGHMDVEPFFVTLDAQTGDATADALEVWLEENASRLGQNGGPLTRDATASAGTSA